VNAERNYGVLQHQFLGNVLFITLSVLKINTKIFIYVEFDEF